MTERRWWHVAILGIAALLTTLSLASAPVGIFPTGAMAAVGVIVVSWFTLGRMARGNRPARYLFMGLLILASGVGTAFEPSFATVQCIAFPLLWTLVHGRSRGILASVALAFSVGVGSYLSTHSLAQTLAIEGISLAVSVGLGLWITSIANQSHERQRLLDELRSAQDRLSVLDRDAGISSERERLAREIHDTIAQDLTGLVMLSQRAQRELATGAAVHETLALLEESARTALAETRALVASSAPVALTSGGITEALTRLGERFERETSVAVTVNANLPPLDRDTEVVLLRCAQEGLSNVRKHAGAASASLDAWSGDGSVGLRITDDGTGFDPRAATDGFGLGGMRDRLALVGGNLDVTSSPAGTMLTATLPIGVSA
ncbi:MAG: sensor histidine kinase [Salinibacterium sp.]|nr:sensor histidine kinase [Salinibacterium sp.]